MNRYSIMAISIMIIISLFIMFDTGEEEKEGIVGYADDIHQKDTGYTFVIIDAEGNDINAFSRIPVDTSLHEFKGNYSADGRMFFVNEIR